MSTSTIGNQFAYNLTPQQRQAMSQALAGNTGQPIQNPTGPVSPLSILAKALQPASTQQQQLATGAAPADANQQTGGENIANAMTDSQIMSMING